MLKDIIISRQLENLEIYKDLYGKPVKRDLLAKVVFLITNPSYFRRPLQSLLLKIHRLPYFNMLFQHFFKSELFLGLSIPSSSSRAHLSSVLACCFSLLPTGPWESP